MVSAAAARSTSIGSVVAGGRALTYVIMSVANAPNSRGSPRATAAVSSSRVNAIG